MEKTKKQSIHFLLRVKGGIIGFKGNSMFPVLKEGFQIKVEPVDIKKIDIGDIVVFSDTDKLIVHRVIGRIKKRNQWFFLEKGDNSSLFGIRPAESVIGQVEAVVNPLLEIDIGLWRKNNFIFIIWCFMICLIYTALSKVKQTLFNNKIDSLTKHLYNFYWEICFLIKRPFFCRDY